MTDEKPARGPRLKPGRVLVVALASAALGLAVTPLVGNLTTPLAGTCPVQREAAARIDAAAVGELAALGGTGEGRGYADLSFFDEDGRPTTLAAFSGRKLLINFWASWCGPCRAEMPALEAIAAKYNSPDFMVLPINLDLGEGGRDKGRAFLAEGGFRHLPLYADPSFQAFERLKREAVAIGLPATLLVDEAGCELAVLQGPAEWDTPDGERVVEALLGI